MVIEKKEEKSQTAQKAAETEFEVKIELRVCPDCGNSIEMAEGCFICLNCGYSGCS